MKSARDGINPAAQPSGTGCVECLAESKWWFHLRRCARVRSHRLLRQFTKSARFETFCRHRPPDYPEFRAGRGLVLRLSYGRFFAGPKLHAPPCHPSDQPVPGPTEAVPSNWKALLHE